MNTTTVPRSSTSSVQTPSDALAHARLDGRLPRTSPIDRMAMRIAVALLVWSSRPSTRRELDRESVMIARRAAADRAERERRWLVTTLTIPRH